MKIYKLIICLRLGTNVSELSTRKNQHRAEASCTKIVNISKVWNVKIRIRPIRDKPLSVNCELSRQNYERNHEES